MTHHRRPAGAPSVAARALPALALATLLAAPTFAASHEAAGTSDDAAMSDAVAMDFSPDLSGAWEGGGEVFANMEQERPFNVNCDFTVDATDTSFDLDGTCGALFVKRPIRVSLMEEGETVSGTYDADLRTGIAELDGTLEADGIEMAITWGGDVNGDTDARMRLERTNDGGLRIVTFDIDPATGEERTTSDLMIERS